jgi:asparagine synthase (glutamine-hydrolysing)
VNQQTRTPQDKSWIDNPAAAPFVFIDGTNGQTRVKGQPTGFVGSKFAVPGDLRPRGCFAEWDWNGRVLQAKVDPLGFFSLFVYQKGGQIAVSPSILQLLAQGADATPDPVAMAVFHRIGFFVGNDTPFAHIHTLPPNGRLTWEDGKLVIEGDAPIPVESSLNKSQAIEAIIEMPRAGIRNFLKGWDGPITLPLTGGRDSRHILLEMVRQGRKPDTCLTFHHGGSSLNAEVQSARAISEFVGARHTILGKPRLRVRDMLRGLFLTQLCADEHAQMMPMHDYLSGSTSAALDGIGGDVLTNWLRWKVRSTADGTGVVMLELSRRKDYTGIARSLAEGHALIIGQPGYHGGAGQIFSPEHDQAAIDRIASAVQKFDGAPDPFQCFYFWNRTRREISFVTTSVLGGAATVHAPYLEPELVELGMALSVDTMKNLSLHDIALQTAFPEAAHIPFSEGFVDQPIQSRRISRLGNMLDGVALLTKAGSGSVIKELRTLVKANELKRSPFDTLRMHKSFVDRMDANEAKRLMALSATLSSAAPHGEETVTDVYPAK